MLTAALLAAFLVPATSTAPMMPVAPLDGYQEARLSALLVWAEAYRSCYEPEPFGFTIDRNFTVTCITRALGDARNGASSDEQAALTGLIAETPRLVSALNAPHEAAKANPAAPSHTARRGHLQSRAQD
jgi:hypothetical protein